MQMVASSLCCSAGLRVSFYLCIFFFLLACCQLRQKLVGFPWLCAGKPHPRGRKTLNHFSSPSGEWRFGKVHRTADVCRGKNSRKRELPSAVSPPKWLQQLGQAGTMEFNTLSESPTCVPGAQPHRQSSTVFPSILAESWMGDGVAGI